MALVTFVILSFHVWGSLKYDEPLVFMVVLFAFLMVSQVQYDSLPDRFHTRAEKVKLAVLLGLVGVSLIALIFVSYRVLLFPLVGLYILFGIVREVYRLFTVGVTKVTGRQYGRRRTDRKEEVEEYHEQ
jgi:hypothetical protein